MTSMYRVLLVLSVQNNKKWHLRCLVDKTLKNLKLKTINCSVAMIVENYFYQMPACLWSVAEMQPTKYLSWSLAKKLRNEILNISTPLISLFSLLLCLPDSGRRRLVCKFPPNGPAPVENITTIYLLGICDLKLLYSLRAWTGGQQQQLASTKTCQDETCQSGGDWANWQNTPTFQYSLQDYDYPPLGKGSK